MTDPSLCKISRPTSPFTGCDRQLCEELHMMCTSANESKSCCDEAVEKEASLLRVSSSNSLGNNLTISLKACDCNDSRPAIMPISLITPPSSPRRSAGFHIANRNFGDRCMSLYPRLSITHEFHSCWFVVRAFWQFPPLTALG